MTPKHGRKSQPVIRLRGAHGDKAVPQFECSSLRLLFWFLERNRVTFRLPDGVTYVKRILCIRDPVWYSDSMTFERGFMIRGIE